MAQKKRGKKRPDVDHVDVWWAYFSDSRRREMMKAIVRMNDKQLMESARRMGVVPAAREHGDE